MNFNLGQIGFKYLALSINRLLKYFYFFGFRIILIDDLCQWANFKCHIDD